MTRRYVSGSTSGYNKAVKTTEFLLSCLWLVGLCTCVVSSFSVVAEHRRSIGAMVQWSEPYVQPFLLLVILGISMFLHEVWILDSSYVTGSVEFNVDEDVSETAVDLTRTVSHGDINFDLAGWYRSSAWKAISGVSSTWSVAVIDDDIDNDEGMYLDTDVRKVHGFEIREGHSAAMDSTFEDSASD